MKKIFVMTESGETHRLYAELNPENVSEIADILLPSKDVYEEYSSLTKADLEALILRSMVENPEHSLDFSTFTLREYTLNTMIEDGSTIIDDESFVPAAGTTVYEIASRIVMGCDQAYALAPIGYFTRPVPSLSEYTVIERQLG